MKRALYLLACLSGLSACSAPVVTSQKMLTVYDTKLQLISGTLSGGRFVSVANAQKTWEGQMKGGKEKWIARRNTLSGVASKEIEDICGTWFFHTRKGPIYNMLDNDETMGGLAPALGVSVAMVAYIAASAATQDTNVPASVYIEFSCQSDEK